MSTRLRNVLARYGLKAIAVLLTLAVNAVYLKWPVLATLGVNQAGALAFVNAALVGVAGHMNLDWDAPEWTTNTTPPKEK